MIPHEPFDSSATWKDLKQLAWSVMLVMPFIALGTFGLAALVGVRTAVWVGVGLATFVVVIFLLIVAMCLVGSYAYERVARRGELNPPFSAGTSPSSARIATVHLPLDGPRTSPTDALSPPANRAPVRPPR